MKKVVLILLGFILMIPVITHAESLKDISEITQYYKTMTYKNNNLVNTNELSHTIEITKEEYENANTKSNIEIRSSGSTETTYKKMTTTIQANGNYYRYKNKLVWKSMPKVRSYDIIGIGFFASLKIKGSTHFEQIYCYDNGNCHTSTTNYPQVFTTGAGTSFALPTGSLSRLEQTFYFDVEKNTSYTIISQEAYGDYSHATSSVSLNNSKKYSVTSGGISLNSTIYDSYDAINKATAIWSGTW